ncbi:protein of unknown function [Cardinium endosymbiont cEper1 of Encarsia pergandiella]|nr:protein of unknown function [Cardinium endosymbiont cEper1 of Encarsia pergandiella]
MVAEWLKVPAWKVGVPLKGYRGFESPLLHPSVTNVCMDQ